MATIMISGTTHEIQSGIELAEAARSVGINPSAFLFSVDGIPVPMDSPVKDEWNIKAIKVASGG